MTLNLFNDSMIHGDCDQCGRLFMFEGPGARERYQAAQREGGADLCKMCIAALHEGEYRWACEGCCAEVTGSLDEVKPLLNCFGKAFCASCRTAFFGRYDLGNEALVIVICRQLTNPPSEPLMGYMIDPAVRAANFEREQAYTKEVRALSRRTLALNVNALNPEGRLLGRAGQAGAYQLDHIVPVTVCFEHDIPIGLAAGISNLQLIPWFVNTSRGNHFSIERLVGWPGKAAASAAVDNSC